MFSNGKILPTWYLLFSIFLLIPASFSGYVAVACLISYLTGDDNLAIAVGIVSFVVCMNLLGAFADWVGFKKLNLGIEKKHG
jgi:hypothetical protein